MIRRIFSILAVSFLGLVGISGCGDRNSSQEGNSAEVRNLSAAEIDYNSDKLRFVSAQLQYLLLHTGQQSPSRNTINHALDMVSGMIQRLETLKSCGNEPKMSSLCQANLGHFNSELRLTSRALIQARKESVVPAHYGRFRLIENRLKLIIHLTD